MLPILFGSDATSWDTFGIGVLSDAISCEVEECRNGSYELELSYPVTGAFFEEIALRSIILAKPNYTDNPQPFRVYKISKPLNGIVTVSARHISYDLSGYIDSPFEAMGIQAALSEMLRASNITPSPCPFSFRSDMSSTGTMAVKHPESVRALMGGVEGSLLDNYGGEWRFDGYTCILNAARGEDRGVTIQYGKNLIDLRQEENNEAVYTAIYPYYYDAESETLVVLPEKTIQAAGTYPFTRIMPLDLSFDFEEAPSVAQLRAKAVSYLGKKSIGVPEINLTIQFLQSDSFSERVDLCDTVTVKFDKLGVSATAKCIRTKWDVLKGRYIEAELGSARNSFADTIAQSKQIAEVVDERSAQFQRVAAKIVSKVTGNSGGYIVVHDSDGDGEPNELLILDAENIDEAVNIIRINNSGIAFSKEGYAGPYITAWNIDGEFVADFIASGEIQTDKVTIFGDSNFTWDAANLTMVDPTDQNKMIRFGCYDGTNYGLGFSNDGGQSWVAGFTFGGIKLIRGVGHDGYASIEGDSFDIVDDSGVSMAHLGSAGQVDDNNDCTVVSSGVYYRLGTWTRYDDNHIYHGNYSFSAGRRNSPHGLYSVSIGYQNAALMYGSIAIGRNNKAIGNGIAMGMNCVSELAGIYMDGDGNITGYYGSIAIGVEAEVKTGATIAIGHDVVASNGACMAVGQFTKASGSGAMALGFHAEATAMDAIAISHGEATAEYAIAISGIHAEATAEGAVAIGDYSIANGVHQFVCGAYNVANTSDIFIIGNGTYRSRKNIVTVDGSGNMTIAGTLHQSSDSRLKVIDGIIPDVSSIRAVKFRWKDDPIDQKDHIGYIAQDVEKVAPYMVGENDAGFKTLDYIELLCAKVDYLEKRVAELTERVERLERCR